MIGSYQPSGPLSERAATRIAVACIFFQTVALAALAYYQSPVLDEQGHLVAGLRHWEFGTFDLYRVNPPLVRMVAAIPAMLVGAETDWLGGWTDDPYLRPEFQLGRRFAAVNGPRVFNLFVLARWFCIPFAWIGGWVTFRWASELYGRLSGLLALIAWCLCPNILCWGATICPDLPAASMGVLAGYTFWRWLKSPSGTSLLFASVSTGLALLTKSSWIILVGIWPALWLCQRCGGVRANRASLSGIITVLVGSIYLVNLGYGFSGSLQSLGSFEFISSSFTGREDNRKPGNRFRDRWMSEVPSPLPADYLRGIDVQKYDFEKGKWSYLRGEHRFGGWWWYYLYALAIKTPIGTLALIALAVVTCWKRRGYATILDEATVLVPGLVLLVLVSSQTGFNRYLRYVLPILPGIFIWSSRLVADSLLTPEFAVSRCESDSMGRSVNHQTVSSNCSSESWRFFAAGLCVLTTAISDMRVWPHPMAYFNEFVGGPAGGHRHLLDANIDWGQGLLAVKDWLAEHPGTKPVYMSNFSWIDPRFAGIDVEPVPRLVFASNGTLIDGDLSKVVPGWYIVSVNYVMGYQHDENDRLEYAWLQEFQPIAKPGHANWIYHLTASDIEAFQKKRAGGHLADE